MASQAFFFVNYIVIRALAIVPLKLVYPHYNVVPGLCFACGLLSMWGGPTCGARVVCGVTRMCGVARMW